MESLARTIFLAGASGAIGRRLTPMLVAEGWAVVGMTRSAARSALLMDLGASPVVVDVYDAPGLQRAISEAQPVIVVHQLTDLPAGLEPSRMEEASWRNAR